MRLDKRKIQLLMAELEIGQQTLAIRAGISRQTLSAVMNGRNCRQSCWARLLRL